MNKTMKMLMVTVLALMLAAALALPALAAWGTMYVNKSKVKVYEYDDTSSDVIKTYKGGKKITVDAVSPDGNWAQITVGDGLGFIQMKYLSQEVPQPFCKHEWGKWTVEREATCTQKGYRYRFCTICGIRDEDDIKKLKHDYTKWKVTKEATCSKKGERVRTCQVCGYEDKEEFYEDHTFTAWTLTKEPTCSEKGERTRTCKVCGAVDKQALDTLPHAYEDRIITEATDHSAGVRARVCVNCGYSTGEESFDPEGTIRRGDRGENVRAMQQLLVEQGYLNAGGADGIFGGGSEKALMKYQQDRGLTADGIAWPQTLKDLEHDFGPWETAKEMTRAEAGERVRVCRGCGFEQHITTSAGTVFEKGRRGEDVRALQQIIKEIGYDAGSFDGIYGKKLDAAMAGFAAANGLTVEEGKVRPADVDAVVNAWFDSTPAESWKGEGSVDSPVNLALTVTPVGEPDESGVVTYNWSLTNMGSEKAMFNALLLTFGDEPDFKKDDLVMVLDGVEMKANCGNSTSGSFTVDSNWGEGNLNFAAMAISTANGDKWLSNAVVFANTSEPEAKTVTPDVVELDVNNLPDGVYPVSFDRGDVLNGASGIYMNGVHIYTMDHYDIVDINTLAVGDTIVVDGEEIPVQSIDNGEILSINAEQDNAVDLIAEEDSNGYRVLGLSDLATYTDHGVTTLVVDPAVTYADSSNIDADPVTANADGLVAAMQASENEYFVQYNTTIRVEAGKVVEINRVYVP